MGGALPGRRSEEINRRKDQAAPQVPDGRPHPGAPARPARPWPAPSTGAAGRRRAPRAPHAGPARTGVHRGRADPGPARPPAAAAAARSGRTTPRTGKRRELGRRGRPRVLGLGASSRCCGPPASGSRSCSRSATTAWSSTGCPTTGELVPLLQIAPSKTDAERLLVISPELADVLSAIIRRVRGRGGAIPLVAAYDHHERVWSPPAPLLFQRRFGGENRAITADSIRRMLAVALAAHRPGRPADGHPLRYTPHDFRRMFITDAVLNGLPPHIAQVIAGHRDINVTMGYKARLPGRGHPGPPGVPRPPPRPAPHRGIPRPHRRRNGRSSSATSNAARSPPEPAAAHSAPPASTSTPA